MNDNSTTRSRDRSRDFDIVLWGATGFTGRLVAQYLLGAYGDTDLRVALAGRNQTKLEAIRDELRQMNSSADSLQLLVGDSDDLASLEAIAQRTDVVCTTVGPYAKYGEKLVDACVKFGTDYCDLCGESQFIRRMIDRHHQEAGRTGARIVHCCGFDSIPSDLGTLMMQEAAREQFGQPLDEVKFFVSRMQGGFSGGTVASLMGVLEEAGRDKATRRVIGHPYGLNPQGEQRGPDGSDQRGVRFDADAGRWTGPFVMAGINTRVVRRSNALMDFAYGRDFRYSEVMSFGAGPLGLLVSAAVTTVLGGFVLASAFKPTRRLLQRTVLPSPGEGPDEKARNEGGFEIRLVGKGHDQEGRAITINGRVEGFKDPGYGETAKMLGESAMCLALDGAKLGTDGGVRTPATAMGSHLTQRLRNAGMVFELT